MKSKILVIDDEESIRFTFDRFLSKAGYEVHTADTFGVGMEKIAEQDFDLIFADILFGGGTGIDILRHIREMDLTCPLILITGYPKVETAADAVRWGAFDYLPKPVQKESLLQITKVALMHKSVVDANRRYRSNLEAIFNAVQDAILMVDGNLQVVEFNQAAEALFALSPDSTGRPLGSTGEHGSSKCIQLIKDTIATKQRAQFHRMECLLEDGSGRVVSLTVTPLFSARGTFSGAVVVVKDETRLANLERDMKERQQCHNIVGRAPRMQEIYALVDDLANVRTSVLITGESGTGKELLADAIHCRGDRKDKPLVKVNCSALSENLLESELFGHVRGAFTGAVKDKIGRFQLADGGTLFLDEIGDISPNVQQRLLRVLQEREFERVGDSKSIKVDVRVIAATNKNLQETVRLGEFREDLYYRLKVVEISLPPLRERLMDIPLLVDHFISQLNATLHRHVEGVTEDVLRLFTHSSWPGNIRQLAHTIEHAFVVCHQNIITVDHLPSDIKEVVPQVVGPSCPTDLKPKEREQIVNALERAAWNKARAARLLGISRRTIHRKLAEHHIVRPATHGRSVP